VHATLYEWFGASGDDLAKAERISERALALAPGLADAHVARGHALSQSQRYDEAAREFEEAIRINPNLFDAYYYFARTAFACGEVARSAEHFRKAGDVRQDDFLSPILLAQSLQMLGREDEAREAALEGIRRAEHILVLNPLDGRALSLGSGALWRVGQTNRALEWSNRALELDPDDVSALLNAVCCMRGLATRNKRSGGSNACSRAAGGNATGSSTIRTTTACATTRGSRRSWPN
jgi:adenylate cyclase